MDSARVITTQSLPVRHFLWPPTLLRTFWRHRGLIRQLTLREVAARYRASSLGLLWSFLLPLALLAVYTFVFSIVFQARFGRALSDSKVEFALTLFCALVPYNLFVETVLAAPTTVVANVNFVKRVVFPLEVLVIVKVGAALVHALIGLAVLLLGVAVFLRAPSPALAYFPLVLLPLVMLALGVGWFLASAGVYLRDTAQIVSVLVSFLFFLTPIFYPVEMVPDRFRVFLYLNPLTAIVENARLTVLWGQPPHWPALGAVTALGGAAMLLGYTWFMKTKRGFADVL